MANIAKVVVSWTGFMGAPGYGVHYKVSAGLVTSYLRTFYDAVKTLIPSSVSIQVPSSGDIVDDVTGVITGSWSTAANAVVVGTPGTGYVGGAGAVVRWNSAGIVNGRRVRGRTFLVPLIGGSFDTNGTLLPANSLTLTNAASALVASEAGNLLVWHRPKAGAGGASFAVTSSDVPDRSALLRSRRD